MLHRTHCAVAVYLACTVLPQALLAAPNHELNQLRAEFQAQIAALQAQYEARISQLEQQLASKTAYEAATNPVASSLPNRAPPSTGFVPEISLILDGKFASTQRSPQTYALRGFIPSGGEIAPPQRGFSLGESELGFSANVDHLFRANARFSIADDGGSGTINTEEAHIETLAIADGLKVKAGRFLSGIGYLNAQHPHQWDFVDAPLAYKAFWGSRLTQDGIQVKWVAPTELYIELGAEAAHGATFPGSTHDSSAPATQALFAHIGGEWDLSNAWQAGISLVHAEPRGRSYTNDTLTNSFDGRSQTWGADLIWKWAPNGNASSRSLTLQSELFSRTEDGSMTSSSENIAATDSLRSHPTGGYAQAVYQFMPRWRVGYRYDWLNSGSYLLGSALPQANYPELNSYRPRRNSVMLDWSPSEFSRLRLQLARDTARGEGLGDNQLFLQYIMSIGAHGAHKF